MKNYCFHFIILFVLAACNNHAVEKPVWLNQTNTVYIPADTLFFKAAGKKWIANLLSFIQPIPLKVDYTDSGFRLSQTSNFGVTEGPAQIIISNGKQHFFYRVSLLNKVQSRLSDKDYRSPKTLNPDSGLSQQRIIHSIDPWRNLSRLDSSGKFFFEEFIHLGPKAGTFRAQADKPLSSFYIQPGSCSSIDVNAVYKKEENTYLVTAGPIKDKHENIVANGTMVAFIYTDRFQTFRTESALLNGFAEIIIPAEKNNHYQLTAKVNETFSRQILLSPQLLK